jgi:hypothetical protein
MQSTIKQDFEPESFKSWIPKGGTALYLAVFLFINLLFAFKYGTRVSLSPSASGLLFALFFGLQVAAGAALTVWAVRRGQAGIWLWALLAVYLAAAYAVYRSMDPLALEIDRWSALQAFFDALFRGEFPWAVKSHLGTNVSVFPGMQTLVLPFYLMGDVGLLQFAGIIGFVVLMVVRYRESGRPFFLLGILLAMPSIQYQVLGRSDLLGNSIAIAWLVYGSLRPGAANGWRLYAWAVAWGVALSTRAIFIIPFIYVAWQIVDGRGLKAMIGVGLVVTATFAGTFLPFYLWDPELFWARNPYHVQSGYVSREVLLLVLVGTVIFGYFRRRSSATFLHTGATLFLTIFICWVIRIMQVGWSEVVWAHEFDLTYFSLCIPFLLLALGDRLPASSNKI